MSEKGPDRSGSPSKGVIASIVVIIVVLWLGITAVIGWLFESDDWGKIGDMFGAVNALFSGLALAGVVFAIWLQREDLKIQQEQLRQSNEEFKLQNQLISDQLAAMKEGLKIERQQLREQSEPSFLWTSYGGNPGRDSLKFKNTGGRFKVVEAHTSPPLNIAFEPPLGTTIRPDQEGAFTLTHFVPSAADLPKPLTLFVTCSGSLDTEFKFKFEYQGAGFPQLRK